MTTENSGLGVSLPVTQNQAWAQDKSSFAAKMMRKMGWEEGKGLGKHEQGRPMHVRVSKKSDTAGLGARTADGTGNTILTAGVQDYNRLLRSLQSVHSSKTKAADAESDSWSSSSSASSSSDEEDDGTHVHHKRYTVRHRYHRHRQSKNVSGYARHDLSAILGDAAGAIQRPAASQGPSRSVTMETEVCEGGRGRKRSFSFTMAWEDEEDGESGAAPAVKRARVEPVEDGDAAVVAKKPEQGKDEAERKSNGEKKAKKKTKAKAEKKAKKAKGEKKAKSEKNAKSEKKAKEGSKGQEGRKSKEEKQAKREKKAKRVKNLKDDGSMRKSKKRSTGR